MAVLKERQGKTEDRETLTDAGVDGSGAGQGARLGDRLNE